MSFWAYNNKPLISKRTHGNRIVSFPYTACFRYAMFPQKADVVDPIIKKQLNQSWSFWTNEQINSLDEVTTLWHYEEQKPSDAGLREEVGSWVIYSWGLYVVFFQVCAFLPTISTVATCLWKRFWPCLPFVTPLIVNRVIKVVTVLYSFQALFQTERLGILVLPASLEFCKQFLISLDCCVSDSNVCVRSV